MVAFATKFYTEVKNMKNITVRKIVLFSIGLLSAIMLLVGLSFRVVELSYVGVKDGLDGFKLLSFVLPSGFREMVILLTQDSEFVELYEILFGITSLLTLVFSILSVGLIVLAFFKFGQKKGEKTIITLLVVSIIITIIHAVFPIIFNIQMSSDMDKMLDRLENSEYYYLVSSLEGLKFSTSAFVPLIFQVVLLVGYIVCSKLIKGTKTNKQSEDKVLMVKEKYGVCMGQEQIGDVFAFEYSVIELLKEYKKLNEDNIITDAEYMEKRVKLMDSSNEKEKSLSNLMQKAPFEDVVKFEKTIVQVLREYKKLAETGIISDAGYIAKKVVLLNCVIK